MSLETASPGELPAGAESWTLTAGFAATRFGTGLLAECPRGVCHLAFVEPGQEAAAYRELESLWPGARILRNDRAATRLADRIFNPRADSVVPLFVRGTPFQLRVWRALLQVRRGTVVSYGNLAGALGHPGLSRALGGAVGANPLAYLIPCHRVIHANGAIGHYRWNPARKRAIIAWECDLISAPMASQA